MTTAPNPEHHQSRSRDHTGVTTRPRRYPIQPLADLVGLSPSALLREIGVAGGQWRRYIDEGVKERTADRYAAHFDLHPYIVWPEMAEHVAADRRARRAELERRRYRRDATKRARKREARRRYYAENGEYERARERARPYDPEVRRARYLRAKARAAERAEGAA